MGDDDLINNEVQDRKARSSTGRERRRKWLKRREKWIVIVGVVLHAIYMLSIFDIYFKTPIVHGMDLVYPSITPPAKRLVLLVGIMMIHTTCLIICRYQLIWNLCCLFLWVFDFS